MKSMPCICQGFWQDVIMPKIRTTAPVTISPMTPASVRSVLTAAHGARDFIMVNGQPATLLDEDDMLTLAIDNGAGDPCVIDAGPDAGDDRHATCFRDPDGFGILVKNGRQQDVIHLFQRKPIPVL
jgi:hypothetical protein